jgi:hypothetical protein
MAPLVHADVAAIHANRLPQETAVLAAFDDVKALEPYSRAWTNRWNYPVAKEDVATRLGKDLGFLTLALKNHPDNTELLLLSGLVARYGYNLDVEGSHDVAIKLLDQAQKLEPADFRAPWFRATLRCQTMELKAGAEEFLTIEAGHASDQLPQAFWEDYMECAHVANLPAHLLRANDHLTRLRAPNSEMRTLLVDTTNKRYDPFDPNRVYEPKEVWTSDGQTADPSFTSTSCGARLRVHGDWKINQLALTKGSCVAYFSTGPYQATVHTLHPSVLLLVQRPQTDETLQAFSKKFQKNGTFEPFVPSHCPAETCIALKGLQPGMYGRDGDGHGRILFFERNEPEFPGLLFEAPAEFPKSEGGEGTKYYRPSQILQRMPGKLYYVVLLDTAASIEEPAMHDFDFFLQNLTVE